MELTPEQKELGMNQVKAAIHLLNLYKQKLKDYEPHLHFNVEHLTLQTAIGYGAFISLGYCEAIANKMIGESVAANDDPSVPDDTRTQR